MVCNRPPPRPWRRWKLETPCQSTPVPKKLKVDAAEAGALETQVDTPAGSPQEKSPPREAQKPAPSTPVQGKGTPSIFAAETIEESPCPGNSDATCYHQRQPAPGETRHCSDPEREVVQQP